MGRQSQHCLEQSHQQHEVFGSHWVLPCLLQCPGCRIWSPTCPCSPQSSPLCPHRPCSPAACPQCPINTFSSPASSSFSSFPCSCPPSLGTYPSPIPRTICCSRSFCCPGSSPAGCPSSPSSGCASSFCVHCRASFKPVPCSG